MRNLNYLTYLTRHNLWTDIVYSFAYLDRDFLYEQKHNFERNNEQLTLHLVIEQVIEDYNLKVAK